MLNIKKKLFSVVKLGVWVNELKQKLKYGIVRKILAIFCINGGVWNSNTWAM